LLSRLLLLSFQVIIIILDMDTLCTCRKKHRLGGHTDR